MSDVYIRSLSFKTIVIWSQRIVIWSQHCFSPTNPSNKVSLVVTLSSDYWNLFHYLLTLLFYLLTIFYYKVKSSNYFLFDRIRRKVPYSEMPISIDSFGQSSINCIYHFQDILFFLFTDTENNTNTNVTQMYAAVKRRGNESFI